MRIGIDASTWSNRRGYGRFTRHLVEALVREHPAHDFVLVTDQYTAAECEFPERARLEVVRTREKPIASASADGSRSPQDIWAMSLAAARLPVDVFYFPTRYSFFPVPSRTPIVLTLHDATAELHPNLIFPGVRSRLFWKLKTRIALFQATRLVTVSEDARRQIASIFGIPPSSIEVITEGPDPSFRPRTDDPAVANVRPLYRLPPDVPLILYVGGISPHKNLQGLLRALSAVRSRLPEQPWHLALVGDYQGDSFWTCFREVSELAVALDLGARVTFTGYVPDAHLVLLYNTATAVVLPSMSEGFGLPLVEAMACGVPVAASNRGSIPEVVGPAGLLFDPASPASMADALVRLLLEAELRAQLRAAGLERARLFSWSAGAATLMRIFEDVCSPPRAAT